MVQKVLCVDDEPDIIEVIKMSLEIIGGMSVRCAGGYAEAMKLLAAERPDVILLDVMMPDISGLDFIKRLYTHEEYRNIPVIFVSARGQAGDIEEYYSSGAVGYIEKPFDPVTLHKKVQSYFC